MAAVRAGSSRCRSLAYLLALAPVLLAGRPTFSSFWLLADSAVHMLGADYLIHHGQDYAHLDLRNSYGQYIHALLRHRATRRARTRCSAAARCCWALPLIWMFQPFNAFMLATATGPAWVLARRIGLAGAWAALAALTATVPALVYGYELVASVKEIIALRDDPRRWARWSCCTGAGCAGAARPRRDPVRARRSPPASSALGVGFGAWALASPLAGRSRVPSMPIDARPGADGAARHRLLALIATGRSVLLVGGLADVGQPVAARCTSHRTSPRPATPATCTRRCAPTQAFGMWLAGSYRQTPDRRPARAVLRDRSRSRCSPALLGRDAHRLRTARVRAGGLDRADARRRGSV